MTGKEQGDKGKRKQGQAVRAASDEARQAETLTEFKMTIKLFNLKNVKGEVILSSASEKMVQNRKAELESRGFTGLKIEESSITL